MNDPEYVFSASTHSLNHISNVLNSVVPISAEVLVCINDDGLTFIAENSHVCRVELFFDKNLFTTFDHNSSSRNDNSTDDDTDDDTDDNDAHETDSFVINIIPIVESLSLALKNVSSTECTISYKGLGSPFTLIFEDNKMIERCEFQPLVNNDLQDINLGFEINNYELSMEGIIKSDVLYDALKNLKDVNSEDIYLYGCIKNDKVSQIAMISKSDLGLSKIFLPTERSILNDFKINNAKKVDLSCYKFNLFEMIFKSIRLSSKCKFYKDSSLLNLKLLSNFGNDLPNDYIGTIINFKILQLIDKEEEIIAILQNLKDINEIQVQQNNTNTSNNNNNNDDDNEIFNNEINIPIFL